MNIVLVAIAILAICVAFGTIAAVIYAVIGGTK